MAQVGKVCGMKLGQKGLNLIKDFERFVPYVYDDKIPAKNGVYPKYKSGPVKGTLTVLFGHTDLAKHPLKIKDAIGKTYSEKFGLEVLDVDLDLYEQSVNSLVKVPLTQGQFDALVSFTFNCGASNLKKLIIPLNNGDYHGCCAKFIEFIRSKGQVMQGLVRRRTAEQSLFNDPYTIKNQNPPQIIPTVTKEDAPNPFLKVVKSPRSWAGASAAISPIFGALTDWRVALVIGALIFAFLIWERWHKP